MLEMHSKADPGSAWVDIHALLRIDGEWYDMNKTATHASRAGWAAPAALRRVNGQPGQRLNTGWSAWALSRRGC
jgi:hypothetical protein